MAFEDGISINIHGYRAMVAIEPETGGANANGIIGVYVLPGGTIQNADLPTLYGTFGNEIFAPYLWGITPWVASNEAPFLWEFAPGTSRNMQRGGRIVLVVRIEGLSAGAARLNTVQTCFTSALK